MRRRQFVAAGGGGLLAALAGCSVAGAPTPEPRHPFAGTTATVRVDDHSDSDHDVDRNAREALDYWADRVGEYAGFEVDFEVVTDEGPDLAIEYVDEPGRCRSVPGHSENVMGCAPVLGPGARVERPATAIVVAGSRPYGEVRITTKHEIGHVLGLRHDDAPLEVMSNHPEDRLPLFAVRIAVWETVLDGRDRTTAATGLFDLGVRTWNAGDYRAAREAFAAADREFATVRGAFEDARARTGEFEGVDSVDLPGLRGHLDRLVRRTSLTGEIAGLMADASGSAVSGDDAASDDRVARANERIRDLRAVSTVEPRDIAVALGLVRGLDRVEPVVDGESGVEGDQG